jgi:hypothetical protein
VGFGRTWQVALPSGCLSRFVSRTHGFAHAGYRRKTQDRGDNDGGNEELTSRGLLDFNPIQGEAAGEVVPEKCHEFLPAAERK